MKYCPNCGNEIIKNSTFCGKCGKKLIEKDGAANSTGLAKSKTAAGVLGICLGTFGVHNFYLGYNGKAIAQLLISLLSCLILTPVTFIWGLIEGILILTGDINVDAEGNPLVE